MQENCTTHLFTADEYCLAIDLSVVHISAHSQTNPVFNYLCYYQNFIWSYSNQNK